MIEKCFPASSEALTDIREFSEGLLEEQGISYKDILSVSLCLEEAFVNIAEYAYPGTSGTMTLGIETSGGSVTLRLTDSGVPFNPTTKEFPDITLPVEERSIGGLGIMIFRKIMDEVTYERIGNQNVLIMKKNF